MVRTMTRRPTLGWKSILAVAAATGVVLWQILACMESPMSFSPSGDLAFTVMDPYGGDQLLAGRNTYRLLVLGKDGKLRELERTSSHMLTGPGYSPDGTQLAYLRIALPTKQDLERAEAFTRRVEWEEKQAREEAKQGKPESADHMTLDTQWIFAAPTGTIDRAPRPLHEVATEIGSLPGKELIKKLPRRGALVPAELIVRDAATGAITASVPMDSPLSKNANGNEGPYPGFYLYTLPPQFLPDGKKISVYLFPYSVIASVPDGELGLLSYGFPGPLSPDGRTLVSLPVLDDKLHLYFSTIDGRHPVDVRLPDGVSSSGVAWLDNQRLAVLESAAKAGAQGPQLHVYSAAGDVLETITLAPIGKASDGDQGELAVSPDGQHLVVSIGQTVRFLDKAGQSLGTWQSDTDFLVQPTFTPDSKQVAFKLVSKNAQRTVAIVFFTPEGRRLSRVWIPGIETPLGGAKPAAVAGAASE